MRTYHLNISQGSDTLLDIASNGNPNALDIEFAAESYDGTPDSNGSYGSPVTIYGVPMSVLRQASSFVGATLTLSGGMDAALMPDSPPAPGILFYGYVFQSYGNWVGTRMSLELGVTGSFPKNGPHYVFNWQPGQTLKSALQQTLASAFPGRNIQINVPNASTHGSVVTSYVTLASLNRVLGPATTGLPGAPFTVSVATNGTVVCGPSGKSTQLKFRDLIGQPVWQQFGVVLVNTVMRPDVNVGDTITMPTVEQNAPGLVITSLPSYAGTQSGPQLTFNGGFNVVEVRHIGRFRDPDAMAWITQIMATIPKVSNA